MDWMRVVYLHGFASSPQSSKAQFFAQKFAAEKISFVAPQLDGGDFEHLTITGQLCVIEGIVAEHAASGDSVVLMGSSLGGYLAALYAARHPQHVDRVVLMAPAFRFFERWQDRFTPEQLQRWGQQRTLPFYHYGSKREQALSYQFVEDARAYEPEPDFRQPGLILHGTADQVVPAAGSREFAAGRPNVALKLFPSGHELTDVVEQLWAEAATFLQILHK
jgi:pimeloyl-ACP methyl ester carboxylesterase